MNSNSATFRFCWLAGSHHVKTGQIVSSPDLRKIGSTVNTVRPTTTHIHFFSTHFLRTFSFLCVKAGQRKTDSVHNPHCTGIFKAFFLWPTYFRRMKQRKIKIWPSLYTLHSFHKSSLYQVQNILILVVIEKRHRKDQRIRLQRPFIIWMKVFLLRWRGKIKAELIYIRDKGVGGSPSLDICSKWRENVESLLHLSAPYNHPLQM